MWPFVVVAVVVVLVAAVGAGGYGLYRSAMSMKSDAQAIMNAARSLGTSASTGDVEGIRSSSASMTTAAHDIKKEASGSLWSIAGNLPVVGQDVANVRTIADVVVDLADNALAPIAADAGALDMSKLMQEGAIDVASIQRLSGALSTAAPVVHRSTEAIEGLPESRIDQVNRMLKQAKDNLVSADGVLQGVNAIMPYLPDMLGAGGQTKTYLIVPQNNAEIRALGGLSQGWITLEVTDGKIEVGDSVPKVDLQGLSDMMTDEEKSAFGTGVLDNRGNFTMTPSYPRAAYWCNQALGLAMDETADGVISVDPVFLQEMLALTGGSVTASDGTVVDGTNAAEALLSDVYWRYGNNGDAEDAFFSEVASLTLDSLMHNLHNVKLTDLMSVFTKSAKEGRFLAWMPNEEQEAVLRTLGVAGETTTDEANPQLGVYFNDATWSKMTWYFNASTEVRGKVKNADGSTTYNVATSMSNVMTPEEASSAAEYITGGNPKKRNRADMLESLLLLAPAGGSVTNVQVDGGNYGGYISLYGLAGWEGIEINVGSGETVTVTYDVTTSPSATSDLTVHSTPLARSFG